MTTVKTAISLNKTIYHRMDVMARRLKVPRSRLCAMALEEFFRREETKALMRTLNEAYAKPSPPEDQAALKRMRRLSWTTVKDRWGEANLRKQSLVNVSQIFTVPKGELGRRIGRLSAGRLQQILNGIRLLTEPREAE